MRTKLRVIALLLAMGVLVFWYFRGANLGATKTSVAQKRVDPVTELEVNDYVKRFVPGLDFLVAGLALSGLIAAGSFLFRKSTMKNQ